MISKNRLKTENVKSEKYNFQKNKIKNRHFQIIILLLYWVLFKIISGNAWTGELYPTVYNFNLSELFSSQDQKLENPNNLPYISINTSMKS